MIWLSSSNSHNSLLWNIRGNERRNKSHRWSGPKSFSRVRHKRAWLWTPSFLVFERQASLSQWPRVTGSHARMAVDGELDGWLHSCKTYLQTWLQTWTPLCGFYSNRREVVEVFVWRTYSESSSSWLFWCDHKERPLKLVKLRAAFLYRCKATSKYMLWKAVWYYWYLSWVTCKGTDYSRTFIQRSSCLVIWIQFYICIY